jgi:predicted regulator of Ras-like GTPase activity (Roadblock/LC7/MglB family)
MDAAEALTRLQDVSSQVEAAVILDRGGDVIASTIGDEERARRVARSGLSLLHEGERRGEALAQLEVALPEGSVFVVVHGERLIAATTAPEPTVGLVFYDLKSCLRDLDREPEPAAEGGE